MKKVFFISGLLSALLLVFLLTGVISFHPGAGESLTKGNRLYAAGNYEEALNVYQEGLKEKPEHPGLNYNSGQTSYRLNHYEKAIEYYSKASGEVDGYLNSGNASLKLGDTATENIQKLQYYQQALEAYKHGILEFPENVPLKYNYEYVKAKIEPLQEDNESQTDQQENNEQREEQQENQSQNQQQDENGQDEQDEQDDEQEDEQGSSQDGAQDEQETEEQQASPPSEQTADELQEIQAVLEMLEKKEEDSLKNNQEVIIDGKEEGNDW